MLFGFIRIVLGRAKRNIFTELLFDLLLALCSYLDALMHLIDYLEFEVTEITTRQYILERKRSPSASTHKPRITGENLCGSVPPISRSPQRYTCKAVACCPIRRYSDPLVAWVSYRHRIDHSIVSGQL